MTRAFISFLSHPYCFAQRLMVPAETSMRSLICLGDRYRFSLAPITD